MAKFELPIYGENDEILKTYATDHCPWAVYIQAAEMQDTLEGKSTKEKIEAVGEVLKSVFRGLTTEELSSADGMDVIYTFQQISNGGQKISGGSSKN